MATRKYAYLPVRWALPFIVTFPMVLTSACAHLAGKKTLGHTIFYYADLAMRYSTTNFSFNPLVRTINRTQDPSGGIEAATVGVCGGASLYFNHLYLHNREKSPPKELLTEIAHLFVEGSPKEATLLHDLYTLFCSIYSGNKPHVLTLLPENNADRVVFENQNEILKLANGPHILRMSLPGHFVRYHAMALIKISEKELYLFDPTHGLFEFKEDEQNSAPKQLNDYLTSAYPDIWKKYLASYKSRKTDLPLSEFRNFFIQIAPCFTSENLPTFSSPDPSSKEDLYEAAKLPSS